MVVALVGGCSQAAEKSAMDENKVAIVVTEKGFEPEVVTVAAGKPVTLTVTRQTAKTCATELVLKEHGIRQDLPLGQSVEITFTPEKPGELRYACGMDMIAGKIVVK